MLRSKNPALTMSLISVGTMAFDAIETPFGKTDQIIGGSATYVAYAASNFVKPVHQISIVGYDFPESELNELKKRGLLGTVLVLSPICMQVRTYLFWVHSLTFHAQYIYFLFF